MYILWVASHRSLGEKSCVLISSLICVRSFERISYFLAMMSFFMYSMHARRRLRTRVLTDKWDPWLKPNQTVHNGRVISGCTPMLSLLFIVSGNGDGEFPKCFSIVQKQCYCTLPLQESSGKVYATGYLYELPTSLQSPVSYMHVVPRSVLCSFLWNVTLTWYGKQGRRHLHDACNWWVLTL